MHLAQSDFDKRLADRRLIIAFIGMSGIGKTFWSKQLMNLGFKHYSCDDAIAARIAELLPSEDVAGLAAWMGKPYSPGYEERERNYLEIEESVTRHGIEMAQGNVVIDTTGSVVYLSLETLQRLKERALVVYLEAKPNMKNEMFGVFMDDPKPVVWGGSFNRHEGESNREALSRCYPELLEYRASRYNAIADVILSYVVVTDYTASANTFIENIRSCLSTTKEVG